MSPEPMLTTEQAAEYLQCHPKVLLYYARLGKVKGGKLGRHWRFTKKALDRFVEVS